MNTGQIIRSKSTDKYTVIPNSILNDTNLSAKAKGILCYLLSKPLNWVVYLSELPNHFKDGEKSIRSGFKELQEVGYVLSVEMRNEQGHFKGFNHVVYDTPNAQNGNADKGISEKGISEKGRLLNTDYTKELTILNTNNSLKEKFIRNDDIRNCTLESKKEKEKGSAQKEKEFRAEAFNLDFPKQMIEEFCDYWTEPDKRGKLRYEKEKTWDINRRLKRWQRNSNTDNNQKFIQAKKPNYNEYL